MNAIWFSSAGWFSQTAMVGGVVLGLGWLMARKATPAAARAVAGWSVRGAVLAAVLCLMPGWITLPAPEWVKPSPAVQSKVEADVSSDVASRSRENVASEVVMDQGNWVLVDMPVDREVNGNVTASWSNPKEVPDKTIDLNANPIAQESLPLAPVETASWRTVITDVSRIVIVAYVFGLAIAAGQLLLAQIALGRIVAAASSAPGRVRELFEDEAIKVGVKARLLLSSRVSSPVCFGLFTPTVVLPKHLAQTAYDDELKWVFAHELDHLRRGDQRLAWWVGVARAMYFFLPPFWAVRKQLGLAQEYLADAAAAATGNAADYAQFLVSLSSVPIDRKLAKHPLTATGVRAGRSDLFRRVSMLVNAAPETTKRLSNRWQALAAGTTIGTAVLLSGFGFAADEKPKAKTESEAAEVVSEKVPLTAADDKAEKLAAEAKAKADEARARAKAAQAEAERAMRDAEKAQADAVKAAKEAKGETAVRSVTATVKVADAKEVEKLKKEIAEAAKNGDMEAVNRATDKLAKLATSSAMPRTVTTTGPGNVRVLTVPPAPAVPGVAPTAPVPPVPPVARGRVQVQVQDAMKTAHEQAMKHFKDAMEKIKDNPEAKAELEKAMVEFQKAMEKAKKDVPPMIWKMADPAKGFEGAQNFEFKMIPDGQFQNFNRTVATGGEGRFGVTIETVPADVAEKLKLTKGIGVKVIEVRPDSAAAKAGVKKDDLLIELAGMPVPGEPQDVVKMIGKVNKDEKVNIVIIRDGKKETIKGVALPEAKATKYRVLENVPHAEGLQLHFENMKLDEKKIHEEMQKVQEEMKKLQLDKMENVEKLKEKMKKLESIEGVKGKLKLMNDGEGGKVEGKNVSMSVSVNDGDYTIQANKDGVKYDIKGTTDGGVGSIVIKDGDKTVKAKNIEGLPEEYRADVKKMLGQVKISK